MSSQVMLFLAAHLCVGAAQVLLTAHVKSSKTPYTFSFYMYPPNAELKNYIDKLPWLGKFQNAWKFLTINKTLHLSMRSYEYDFMYGNDSECVTTNLLAADDRTATINVSYINPNHQEVHFKLNYTINRTAGYKEPNVLMALHNSSGDGYCYPVIFSDYETCGIVRAPHYGNDDRPACQLWVAGDKAAKAKNCCQFIYDLICGPHRYNVYNTEQCEYKETRAIELAK